MSQKKLSINTEDNFRILLKVTTSINCIVIAKLGLMEMVSIVIITVLNLPNPITTGFFVPNIKKSVT